VVFDGIADNLLFLVNVGDVRTHLDYLVRQLARLQLRASFCMFVSLVWILFLSFSLSLAWNTRASPSIWNPNPSGWHPEYSM